MTLFTDVLPLTMDTEPRGKPSAFSMTRCTDRLALPFSGGALTLTFRVFSSQPAIQSLDEEGMTLIESIMVCSTKWCFHSHTLCSVPRKQVRIIFERFELQGISTGIPDK